MELLIFEIFWNLNEYFPLLIAKVYTIGEHLGCDCACYFLNVSLIEMWYLCNI